MFIGRERELRALEALYQSEKFEFAVLYGRRRVGKTALINQFIRGKRAVYFMGVESNARQNLENFSRCIMEGTAGISGRMSFSSFQEALDYVFQQAEKDRLILAIDEYPYVARGSRSFASTLQRCIDAHKETSRLLLILCGSSMSYMEDHVLAYKAPLYGRRTAQIRLLPFDFADTCRCVPGFSGEDKALIYGITGGTPQYILQMDDQLSAAENIRRTFLNPISALFEEPENLLKQEVREPALYNAILSAIAGGASRLSEITSKAGESSGLAASHLKNLMELGIVRRETPYGEKQSRRSIYLISDPMFRFWYRFVPDNYALIARGAPDAAWQRIAPYISEYMGKIFEEICQQYLWTRLLAGTSPVQFASLGRWWGTDPAEKKQTEIDIMGEENKDTALFAECKWTNEKADVQVLETLVHRSRLFSYRRTHLFLFAKTGFTRGCREAADQMGNVSLVTYEDM